MDKHVEHWLYKKINDMQTNERNDAVSNLIREKETMFSTYIGCSERIIKALFLMNSGGVLTSLAYIHTNISSHNEKLQFMWLFKSLYLFLIGLVCAFIIVAYDYIVMNRRYSYYLSQMKRFIANEINFSDIEWFNQSSRDSCLNKLKTISYFLFVYFAGFISFICVIAGISLGVFGYLSKLV